MSTCAAWSVSGKGPVAPCGPSMARNSTISHPATPMKVRARASSRFLPITRQTRPQAIARARSGRHCGHPTEPGPRLLELGGETEDRGFPSVAGDDLHGDGEPLGRRPDREHHGRLAGDVEPHGERGEREDAAPVLIEVVEHHVDPPELDGPGRES